MALNEKYIVSSDLESLFRDKDSGLPLANGKIFLYRDAARDQPKIVYQLSGDEPDYTYTSMGAVITLSSIGTVQNSGGDNEIIYWYPWTTDANGNEVLDLYYVVVTDQNGVEQFTREAWPNVTSANNPTDEPFNITNQIANPQFTNVFINEGFSSTFSVTGATETVFPVAPDWDLVLSGTGNVIISRVAIAGNENVITSPPYIMDLNISAGLTACYLRQRMKTNSGLWASTDDQSIYLSGCIVGRNENVGNSGVQIIYRPSSGNPDVIILDGLITSGSYSLQTGVTESAIPASADTNKGTDGYVDILVSFLASSHVRISSVQVVPTLTEAGADFIKYDTNSSNREEALQGDYYLPTLIRRPARSLLVGWDFPLNPSQFENPSNITTTARYIMDQTIAVTQAGTTGWSKDASTGALSLISGTTNNVTMVMQYLSAPQALKIIGTPLSVNIFGYRSTNSDDVTLRVYLLRGSSAASFPSLPAIPGTLNADGTFTVTAANWTEIPRSNLDTAKAIMPYIATAPELNDERFDISFNGWEITDAGQIADTNKFAIVITMVAPDASTNMLLNSVSLVASEVPARPALQTLAEVFTDCQYYFEKSYNMTVLPGTSTIQGAINYFQFVGSATPPPGSALIGRFFTAQYQTRKRISVTPVLYSIAGTTNFVTGILYDPTTVNTTGDIPVTAWTLYEGSDRNFIYNAANRNTGLLNGVGATIPLEAVIQFHYVADARLGIV